MCLCLFSTKKSETAIETGAFFSVWIKTSSHISTELAEGSQKRGSKGEEEEAEEETRCCIAIVKHAF
jgi:hypothetical protein